MSEQPATTNAKKILVVDDDEVILKTLSITLSSNGYYVYLASDGAEAVRVVTRERPDLIVLDIIFPVDAANVGGALQDGYFIMQWLRRMGEAEGIPIIIMSGENSPQEKEKSLKAGAVAYFSKPIDHVALLAKIGEVVGGGIKAAEVNPS